VSDLHEITLGSKILQIFMGPVAVGEANTSRVIGTVLLIEDTTEATIQARSKDEFFSIASHELRTPLTAIRGNASMIQTMYSALMMDTDLAQMIGDIKQSSARLIEIVNDFLDVSSIEQGKISYALGEVRPGTVIQKVADAMKPALQAKTLRLDIEPKAPGDLPSVIADAGKVEQVMYNLITNAVKFTEKGGIIVTTTKQDTMLKISVTDTGQGIPVANQPLLFRKFQQAGDSLLTRGTAKGTGLGLYISRLLVEGMGGQMLLERSDVGKGSTFSFTLPIATDEQLANLQATVAKPPANSGATHSTSDNQAKTAV
jgi:signal transduction histidine kinase